MASLAASPITTPRQADTFFVIAVSLVICAYAWGVGFIAPGLQSYSFGGIALAYLYWFRLASDRMAITGGTVLLAALYASGHAVPLASVGSVLVVASGLAAIGCLVGRWSFARGVERKRIERIAALPALIIALSDVAMIPQLITYGFKGTVDQRLLSWDRMLFGFDPTYYAGRIALAVPYLRGFIGQWYLALGFGMIACMVPLALEKERLHAYIRTLVATGVFGFLIYCAVPGVGPIHAFAGYPFTTPGIAIPDDGARNAFPSLHMSWAILMLLYARKGWPKWLAVAFVVMTFAATLGLGEHYVVDLLVAVPFTLGLDRLCRLVRPLPVRPIEDQKHDLTRREIAAG